MQQENARTDPYRGRIAPTPTGLLHAGHAATFRTAWRRAREAGGQIVLRIEDLDPRRCRRDFANAAIEDLRWLGLDWDEGPLWQSERRAVFFEAWDRLRREEKIYPCRRSRREISEAAPFAPHEEEPVYPAAWRPDRAEALRWSEPGGVNWRFRVPDGREVAFEDRRRGRFARVAGRDFGDFLVWNREDVPAYELAVVADDAAMGITEVVRGEDLLLSTCRQVLICEALGLRPPAYYHCPLVRDGSGRRLAKRSRALSLRALRERGWTPERIDAAGHLVFEEPAT